MNQSLSVANRLHVVDALRGFAIVSILLLHNLEHFDYYYFPQQLPEWMKSLDKSVWSTVFFLFSGKSYAIFALLFGLTFHIQDSNQKIKNKDFRGRFAWRLVLLFLFGMLNSAFYEGDILTIYAIIGFCLIPVARLKDKTVVWIALILMLQPYEWYQVIWGINHPAVKLADPASWAYFGQSGAYIESNSLIKTIVGNYCNGKKAVYLWTWEEGRVFQTASLFMFGMLAGRKGLFANQTNSFYFWKKTLIGAVVAAIPLYVINSQLDAIIPAVSIHRPLGHIIGSWYNIAFMLIIVSTFILLFRTQKGNRILAIFQSFGKMSMSNYIIQSLAGAIIYCGFGFGLYRYTGATYCLLIGITLAIAQGIFSTWWMKNHKQGPLENIWHKLTWLGTTK